MYFFSNCDSDTLNKLGQDEVLVKGTQARYEADPIHNPKQNYKERFLVLLSIFISTV